MWPLILLVLSKLGGWSALARRYRHDEPYYGIVWTYQYGSLGAIHYKGVLTVGSGREGLYLAVSFLFRLFHPPLLIPWPEVSVGGREQTSLKDLVEFRLGPDPLASLRVPTALAQGIANAPGAYLYGSIPTG